VKALHGDWTATCPDQGGLQFLNLIPSPAPELTPVLKETTPLKRPEWIVCVKSDWIHGHTEINFCVGPGYPIIVIELRKSHKVIDDDHVLDETTSNRKRPLK